MELTSSQKETVRHQFDCFCKLVLRSEARTYMKQRARRAEHEESLAALSETQLLQFCAFDEYLCERTCFDVQGYFVVIRNERLAAALAMLPESKRSIVLLYYFFDMRDQAIADHLNLNRKTVQYRRASALKEMRKRLESAENDIS